MSVGNGITAIETIGLCEDGCHDTIVSPLLADREVKWALDNFCSMYPVRLQVGLMSRDSADKFTFSRTWSPPRTIGHLVYNQLGLALISYLVTDDDLRSEEMLT